MKEPRGNGCGGCEGGMGFFLRGRGFGVVEVVVDMAVRWC